MRGRFWLVAGAGIGVAVSAGRLPYLAGAGRSLSDTTERLVNSGANRIIADLASAGAPKRLVLVLGGVIAVMVPGLASLLLVVAARGTLRIRAVVAFLIVALGVASYFYQPHGKASGVLVLALVIAGLAVTFTGPLVAAPLAALAGLIAGEFLPALVSSQRAIAQSSVSAVHTAIFNRPGTPAALQITMLIFATIPFLLAARLILTP